MEEKIFTPFPVLKTARLELRQLHEADDKKILALRSDEDVNKYLGRKPSKTIDDARQFIQTINENIERNDSVYWAVALQDTGELVGTICLFNFDAAGSHAEIGYELLPQWQGMGLMQEAAASVIGYGVNTLGLKSIEAYTAAANRASVRLLERFNFEQETSLDNGFLIYMLKDKG